MCIQVLMSPVYQNWVKIKFYLQKVLLSNGITIMAPQYLHPQGWNTLGHTVA